MQTRFLNKKISSHSQHSTPWTHWLLDDFLPTRDFDRFQKKFCRVNANFKKRTDDEVDIHYMFLPDLELARFFLGSKFREFLEILTGERLEIHSQGLVQLRRMDSTSPAFPNHIDSQEQRSLVCLFYVSPDWMPGCGGELCLHQTESTTEGLPKKLIPPLANRLVLFFSEDDHWHSVNKLNNWIRYSIVSEWLVQKD